LISVIILEGSKKLGSEYGNCSFRFPSIIPENKDGFTVDRYFDWHFILRFLRDPIGTHEEVKLIRVDKQELILRINVIFVSVMLLVIIAPMIPTPFSSVCMALAFGLILYAIWAWSTDLVNTVIAVSLFIFVVVTMRLMVTVFYKGQIFPKEIQRCVEANNLEAKSKPVAATCAPITHMMRRFSVDLSSKRRASKSPLLAGS